MPIALLLAQTGTVLVAGALLARLLQSLKQPRVIAEIVAGIVLGPSVLGVVWPGAMQALFPPESLPLLGAVAELALVFFMFLVGLEFEADHLGDRAHAAVAVSVAGTAIPLVAGALVATQLPAGLAGANATPLTFALFVGVAMSVTAFPVLARILTERRLVHSRIGAIALAAAAVGDVAGWSLLAVVAGIAAASGLAGIAWTVGGGLLYTGIVWMGVRPWLHRRLARSSDADATEDTAVVSALVIASAWITHALGLHALFGGFLMGAAMPGRATLTRDLPARFGGFVTPVLLPLFFAFSGVRTRIGLLDSSGDWLLLLALLLLATVVKIAGAGLAARLTGSSPREALAIGVLMNTRGLMEVVVLNIGLDLGIISGQMFAIMVLVALLTTAATPPLLAALGVDPGGHAEVTPT